MKSQETEEFSEGKETDTEREEKKKDRERVEKGNEERANYYGKKSISQSVASFLTKSTSALHYRVFPKASLCRPPPRFRRRTKMKHRYH